MLVDDIGDVTITNDGATILKMLEVEHPAAKVGKSCPFLDISMSRDFSLVGVCFVYLNCFIFAPGAR